VPTPLYHTVVGGRDVRLVATDRSDGDVHPDHVRTATLRERQVRATGHRWTMLDEVHGTAVVDVDVVDAQHAAETPADVVTSGVGDVAVTERNGTHLAVWTADCAPIFLLATDGTVVGAHGGWRGLAAGVIDVAVSTATRSGGGVAAAVLGPSIRPCCYAFGGDDLDAVATGVHADRDVVEGVTRDGEMALDVAGAVRAGLGRHGIDLDVVGPCTGCDERWFSHRVRADPGRQATIAVIGR